MIIHEEHEGTRKNLLSIAPTFRSGIKTPKKSLRALALFILLSIIPTIVNAHHGKDFFATASLQLPHQGQWFGILSSDYMRNPASLSLEPGVLYGVMNYWSVEAHAHLDDFNTEPHFSSIGLEQRFSLWDNTKVKNDTASGLPIALGILVEFEKGIGHHHDGVELRGLFTYMGEHLSASVNLIGVKELHEEPPSFGYALGLRHTLMEFLAIGIETRGTFDGLDKSVITPNVFIEVSHSLNLLVGSSLSFSPQSQNPVLQATLLYAL
jgi:hypothetical protein